MLSYITGFKDRQPVWDLRVCRFFKAPVIFDIILSINIRKNYSRCTEQILWWQTLWEDCWDDQRNKFIALILKDIFINEGFSELYVIWQIRKKFILHVNIYHLFSVILSQSRKQFGLVLSPDHSRSRTNLPDYVKKTIDFSSKIGRLIRFCLFKTSKNWCIISSHRQKHRFLKKKRQFFKKIVGG